MNLWIKIRYGIVLIAFLLLHMHIYAQNSIDIQKQKTEAKVLFQEGNYYQAGQIYKAILDIDSTQIDITYAFAECNRHLLNYLRSEYWYSKVCLMDQNNEYPEAWFYRALAEKGNGKYKEAKEHFQYYLSIGKKASCLSKAKNEINSCNFALSYQNDSTYIEVEHLPAPINTEFSEFNPVPISSSELVFSRYQNVFKDTFESIFSQSYISDIMTSKITEQGWLKPRTYSKKFQDNTDFIANICFNHSYRKAYVSICKDLGGQVGNCAIYSSNYKNGKWSKPKRLNKDINVANYSSTQAFLVEKKDFDILYFASNRPGGQGGMDLWYVLIKDGKYQTVTNLGSIINTQGSELTPTYDSQNNKLYFSSDWHQGFGGYDIFSSSGGLGSWSKPKNLGLPINSASNDLYYIQKTEDNEAWFSSNRLESFHQKNAENCCSDIYNVHFEPKVKKPIEDSIPTPIVQIDSIEKKIQKLLPLTLYFHNDIPDPRSTSPTTDKNYQDLLDKYFELKDKYKKEYSRGLKGEKSEQAKQDVEDFFNNYVGHGFEDLEKLAALLKKELGEGKDIRLKIRGYASPLNTSDYNLNLSKRRIASLVNYLKSYDNGYFLPYFEGTAKNGGSISIFEDPLGDTQAADFVSDNPNDKRNSVYNRAAAMERKIQIILYSSNNTITQDISNKEFPMLQLSNISNLGSLKQGSRKIVKLSFKNSGKSELHLKSVTATCPCISVQLKKNLFQPNESGIIYLLIQAEELKPGDYDFKLTIKSNMLENILVKDFSFQVL
jgi:hypothetical protein